MLNFGKVSKLQYTAGSSLSINASYTYSKPAVALPRIISGSVNKASIAAIKRYICSEYAAKFIASKTGIPFENLINGDYKLVIEPIAYFTHNGKNYAMTATEAALYNKLSGGALRRVLPSLTHQNLPLALFLEKSDLGYPAWTGSTSGKVSDDAIISSLGIGIVSYKRCAFRRAGSPGLYVPCGYGCYFQHYVNQCHRSKPEKSGESNLLH